MRVTKRERSLSDLIAKYTRPDDRILNIGSGDARISANAVNLDVVPGLDVDVVGDAHDLPFDDASFDVCILSAVLQYCANPFRVVAEARRVLVPAGTVLVDVPFVQPYCPERVAVDRFRFTRPGLMGMFEDGFEVLECGVAMAGGSALAFLCRVIADTWSRDRYLSFALRSIVSFFVWPVSRLRFGCRADVAGALFLVGRKVDEA